jgi:DNA-binding CsgD family transcriptional regulator
MPRMDHEYLSKVVSRVPGFAQLSPAERAELARIAQGFACKDSAQDAHISPETIRARRKRIYGKLGYGGSGEVLAVILKCSLELLAEHRRERSAAPASP